MKKTLPLFLIAMMVLFSNYFFAQDFTYVGAEKCKMCHKSEKSGQQHPLWESRKHSKSIVAMTSDSAAEYAQAAGVTNPAADEKCLKCHAPLHAKAPELNAEGVTCEACHGPGSEYKKLTIMKDHAQSVANGLTDYKTEEDIKAQCLACHDDAHGKSFDFATAWEKVKHPVPDKE